MSNFSPMWYYMTDCDETWLTCNYFTLLPWYMEYEHVFRQAVLTWICRCNVILKTGNIVSPLMGQLTERPITFQCVWIIWSVSLFLSTYTQKLEVRREKQSCRRNCRNTQCMQPNIDWGSNGPLAPQTTSSETITELHISLQQLLRQSRF